MRYFLLDSHIHSTLNPTNEDNSDQNTFQNNQAPTSSFNSAFSDLTPLRPDYYTYKFTKFKSDNLCLLGLNVCKAIKVIIDSLSIEAKLMGVHHHCV